MRTTMALEDDALEMLREYAQKRGVSLGRAASALIRNGTRYQVTVKPVNGLPVFDVPADFPEVTDEQVARLRDEE